MTVAFYPPGSSNRYSDLTIQISPLGLVELADEEFEVHGPRLNRYAQNWALYLGHHYGYRREEGEFHAIANYIRAFSDYLTNFTLGRGVEFKTPPETEGIVPYLLRRIWNDDNDKQRIIWEIGSNGSVSGDTFVKVAYEDPFVDPAGVLQPGKIRIIPINSAHAFPEFHPHDRKRIIRFKLKYRFWGTSLEGTRQIHTYTEITTESQIEEYVNNELIDARPNPLGILPYAYCPNIPVSGSPWGLSDIQDIVSLQMAYNNGLNDLQDIINYQAQPITVITGAKASSLERSARKIWAGLPKEAKVSTLELDPGVIQGILAYMEQLKVSMHEMTGVPVTALGQLQPISNTSAAALAATYQPLMTRRRQKIGQYGQLFEDINAIALKMLFLYEPWCLEWNPLMTQGVELKAGQYQLLDPLSPTTYRSETEWPEPLPLDQLVKLQELQAKMALGLQSKRGGLRELGDAFPDQTMAEIQEEQRADAIDQSIAALLQRELAVATEMVASAPVIAQEDPETGEPVIVPAAKPKLSPELESLAMQMRYAAYGYKRASYQPPPPEEVSE